MAGHRAKARALARRLEPSILSDDILWSLGPADLACLAQILDLWDDSTVPARIASAWVKCYEARAENRPLMTIRQALVVSRLMHCLGMKAALAKLPGAIESELSSRGRGSLSSVELVDALGIAVLAGSPSLRAMAENGIAEGGGTGRLPSKQLSPHELAAMAACNAQQRDLVSVDRLCAFVVSDYLSQPGLADSLDAEEWLALAEMAGRSGQESIRLGMADIIDRCLSGSAAATTLKPQHASALVEAMRRLTGGNQGASGLVAGWLGLGTEWAGLTEDTRSLTVLASGGNPESLDALNRWAEDELRAEKLSPAECKTVCSVLVRLGRPESARQISLAALDAFTADGTPSAGCLRPVCLLASSLSLAGAAPEVGQAEKLLGILAQLEPRAAEVPDAVYRELADVLANGAGPAVLRANLVTDRNSPDLAVAKVLAWVRQGQGAIRPFIGEMGQMLEASRGDTRALWELARAYAAGLTGSPVPRRSDGNGHLSLALMAAETEAVSLRCIEEAASAGIASRSPEFPLQVIQSTAGRFGPAAQARLAILAERLARIPSGEPPVKDGERQSAAARECWRRLFDQKRELSAALAGGDVKRAAVLRSLVIESEGSLRSRHGAGSVGMLIRR